MSTDTLPTVDKGSHRGRNQGTIGNSRVATPAEIRAWRGARTQAQCASIVRGSEKAWKKWEAEGGPEARRMHPGLTELFLIKTGQPVPEWLKGSDDA